MTDLDVRDALERATGHLDAPPDLLDRVRAGGRRRVVRRRSVLAAGLAAAVAGSAAAIRWHPGRSTETLPASDLLDLPTRGDLAGDKDFLRQVRAAWPADIGEVLTLGPPHVAWAGQTPAGPVALVAQRIPIRQVPGIDVQEFGIIGFVERVDGRLVKASFESLSTASDHSRAFLAGPRRDVLVVIDDGRPVGYSPELRWDDQGRPDRTFTPLTFRDGASVTRVPTQAGGMTIGLRSGDSGPGLTNVTAITTVRTDPMPTIERRLGGVSVDWDAVAQEEYQDRFGYPVPPQVLTWRISGALPDGSPFVVQTLAIKRTVRTYIHLGGDTIFAGLSDEDPAQPASLRVRLPGGRGFVVATESASLAYRVGNGDWLPVQGDAALLPPAATSLRVTRGGRPAVEALPD